MGNIASMEIYIFRHMALIHTFTWWLIAFLKLERMRLFDNTTCNILLYNKFHVKKMVHIIYFTR